MREAWPPLPCRSCVRSSPGDKRARNRNKPERLTRQPSRKSARWRRGGWSLSRAAPAVMDSTVAVRSEHQTSRTKQGYNTQQMRRCDAQFRTGYRLRVCRRSLQWVTSRSGRLWLTSAFCRGGRRVQYRREMHTAGRACFSAKRDARSVTS